MPAIKKKNKKKSKSTKNQPKVVEKHYYHDRPRDDSYYPRRYQRRYPARNSRKFNLNSYIDSLFSPYSKRRIRNTLNRSRNIRNNTAVPRRQRLKNQMSNLDNMFVDAQSQHGFKPVSLVNNNMLNRVENMSPGTFNNTWNAMYVPVTFDPITNFDNLQELYGKMLSLNMLPS